MRSTMVVVCLNPQCSQKLRVPTHQGRVRVRCPKCGTNFDFTPPPTEDAPTPGHKPAVHECLHLEGYMLPIYADEATFFERCASTGMAAFRVRFRDFWDVYRRGYRRGAVAAGMRLFCPPCVREMPTSYVRGIDRAAGGPQSMTVWTSERYPATYFDSMAAGVCPWCERDEGVMAWLIPKLGPVTQADLDALRTLWRRSGLSYWGATDARRRQPPPLASAQAAKRGRVVSLGDPADWAICCESCDVELTQPRDTYFARSGPLCASCVDRRLSDDALEQLRGSRHYFGIGELERARSFASWRWTLEAEEVMNGTLEECRAKVCVDRRWSSEDATRGAGGNALFRDSVGAGLGGVGLDLLFSTLAVNLRLRRYCYTEAPSREQAGRVPSCVVVDGYKGKGYPDGIRASGPLFSDDGTTFGYIATEGKEDILVVNWRELARYPAVLRFAFSPDGTRTAFNVEDGGSKFMVIDGTEGPRFEAIWEPRFSPNGKHVAYGGKTGAHYFVVLDGERIGPLRGFPDDMLYFSPDGDRLAIVTYLGDKWALVVDGEQGPAWESLVAGSIAFSPDSRHVGYGARTEGAACVVIDHEELARLPAHASPCVALGPSGQVAYSAGYPGEQWVVREGEECRAYQAVFGDSLRYSPDGSRLAWIGQEDEGMYVVVDDEAFGPYERVKRPGAVFSPDSRHVAFAATTRIDGREREVAVLDGIAGPPLILLPHGGEPQFLPERECGYRSASGGDWFLAYAGLMDFKYNIHWIREMHGR